MTQSSISADEVLSILTQAGYGPIVAVPCSFLTPLYDAALAGKDEGPKLFSANNEGEAIAIAVGAQLAGQKPLVMFQNSGLGNAFNPLSSLVHTFSIPLTILVTHRGKPGLKDAPQHELMGKITQQALELLDMTVADFPACPNKLQELLSAQRTKSLALVLAKGTVSPSVKSKACSAESPATVASACDGQKNKATISATLKRNDVLRLLFAQIEDDAAVISTTGKTSREVFFLKDRPGNFYTVGSMGCASSIGLGLALSQPKRKVIVIDGDGAALMRLEALVGIGHHKPKNLIHLVLDNGCHDSTGGQPTQSQSVHLPTIAKAVGYSSSKQAIEDCAINEAFEMALRKDGPHFIHIPILPGSPANLGRPDIPPKDLAQRFKEFCQL